jgi:hypothetical protein
MYRFLGV